MHQLQVSNLQNNETFDGIKVSKLRSKVCNLQCKVDTHVWLIMIRVW